MLARILVEAPRLESYADTLAAIVLTDSNIGSIEFLILPAANADAETLLNAVEVQLNNLKEHDAYKRASRLGRSARRIDGIDEAIFHRTQLVDASSVFKETLVDISSVAVSFSRKRVRRSRLYILTWKQQFERGRFFRVGQDEYSYEDIFERSLFRKSFAGSRASTLLSFTLMVVIAILCAAILPQLVGFSFISDRLMNNIVAFIGIVTGIGGFYLSYVSLQKI